MSPKPETLLVGKILTALRKLPKLWVFKVHGGLFQLVGVPDLIGVYDGVFFGMEVKMPKGTVAPIQTQRLREIERAGGATAVVRSVQEALDLMRLIDGRRCACRIKEAA